MWAVPAGRFDLVTRSQELGTVAGFGHLRRVYSTGSTLAIRCRRLAGLGDAVSDWTFDPSVRYRCLADAPLEVVVPDGDSITTQITIHGDHLFYDSLAGEGEELQGLAIVNADADADGTVTLEELAAVDVATIGYPVGTHTEITNMADFIARSERCGPCGRRGHCCVD